MDFKGKITQNMIENMLTIGVAIVVLIVGFIVGNIASIAEDHLWLVTNPILPNCDDKEGDDKKFCKSLNQFYYS